VIRFVDNPGGGLHLTLEMRGTPLQRRVWEKLRSIPVGRTMTYYGVRPFLRTKRLQFFRRDDFYRAWSCAGRDKSCNSPYQFGVG
jgi:6-O-methylguanine DNA methyltransferase, DNA binding domain